MSAILTSTGVTFSDSTTQSTAALPLTGGTMSGSLSLTNINANNGVQSATYKQYTHGFTAAQAGGSLNLMYNNNSYSDVHFYMTLIGYHSGRSYQSWSGVFGGYGANFGGTGGGGAFSLSTTSSNSGGGSSNLTSGYNYLNLSWSTLTAPGGMSVYMQIYGSSGIAIVNGTLYN